ncbi:MAG: response regulator transcription factor [Kiritimatiellia bacterium]|jgi:DNA-binding NarL/FixJ family response regulator|nr:response regulator transcription factor [Kiritimatiellia bacterium]
MGKVHRVFLVDDHPILRDGLAQLIEEDPSLNVCGEAANVEDAAKRLELLRPDLAIVDIFLEGSNGIDLTKIIRDRWPQTRVLILSMHDEAVYARRALRAGALGYVMKQEVSRTILNAIHTVLQGRRYVSEQVALNLKKTAPEKESEDTLPGRLVDALGDRELEVFELFGHGLSRTLVAERLKVSVKTVDAHRQHIKEKLDIKDATEFMRRATLWVEVDKGEKGGA